MPGFIYPLFAFITATRVFKNIKKIATWYDLNKTAQAATSFPFGFLYAGGTVIGYNTFSAHYKPKWKYLGSPQRVKGI